MKIKYVSSHYNKFIVLIILLAIITTTFGCGSSNNTQYEKISNSLEYSGSVALSWNAPTLNEDGSPLTDLSGYKIYYGTSSNDYQYQLDVGSVTSVNLSNLAPGTYYFRLAAYDKAGNESDPSGEISRYIEDTSEA